jgi:hypothetical protein
METTPEIVDVQELKAYFFGDLTLPADTQDAAVVAEAA